MSRPLPFNTRLPTAVFLCGVIMFLIGSTAAAVVQSDPVEITFETTSPYYQPRVAVVSAGTPVRWVNTTGSPHSVRHDECLTDGACAFQSVAVPPDNSFHIAPLPPGRYAYHCELHPIMRGTLVIVDPLVQGEGIVSAMEQTR